MKSSLFSTTTTTAAAATTSSSAIFINSSTYGNLRENSNSVRNFYQLQSDSIANRSSPATPTGATPSFSKLERLPDYFRDTMDWLIGRSRRKGAVANAAATTTGQTGCDAAGPASALADKENVEHRQPRLKNKTTAADGGAGASSCSSGSDAGSAEDDTGRRYQKQPRKGAQRGGTVPESRSADLASVSSASGVGALGVCDSITESDLERLVKLPIGMDAQEWMASHTMALFHHVNALYGVICELCTKDSCPVMNGPGSTNFIWVDEKNRKVKYPAPQYVDCVMSFAERTVRSEEIFPTKFGHYFPANFDSTLRKLCRLLYHVLAHLHIAHWEHLRLLGVLSQATVVHWHLASFVGHFQLLESKDAAGLIELTGNLRRMVVVDESIVSEVKNNEQERDIMDAGTCESPPTLQDANAQVQ